MASRASAAIPNPTPSAPMRPTLVVALATTMMIGPFSLDTYLPAFPAIARSLHTTTHEVALSVSVYVFMLALGQLLGGALSDRLGRKKVLLSGLALFSLISLALSQVQSLPVLLAGRALQAVGAGWALVSVPALVRDRVQGQEAAKLFSLLGLIMVVAPGIAPSVGSVILHNASWRAIFVILALYAFATIPTLLLTVFREEPGAPATSRDKVFEDAPAERQPSILESYAAVLRQRDALPFIAWQVGAFSTIMLFVTNASFIYQEHFAQDEASFSILFGANIVAMFCINIANRLSLSRQPSMRLLQIATAMQGAGAIMLVIATLMGWGVYAFLPAMMLTIGAMGAISPNIQACFMEHFPRNGGAAAALLGAAQFGLSGAISALSTQLPRTLLTITLMMLMCSALAVALMFRSLARAAPTTNTRG